MAALEVALDAFGAEHAAIERELLPGLEADDVIFADAELDPALLPAEAAVGLDELRPGGARLVPSARRLEIETRAEALLEGRGRRGKFSHGRPRESAVERWTEFCVCRRGRAPATRRRDRERNNRSRAAEEWRADRRRACERRSAARSARRERRGLFRRRPGRA